MRYRIALVEYLNTRPFTEGLRLTGLDRAHDLLYGPPVDCARLFAQDEVDISLCPVGALPFVGDYQLWGRYCIGADGPVRTVMLLSRVPLEAITRVRLDDHSRTSNRLLAILAQRAWNRQWLFDTESEEALPESALMIGDKVFHYAEQYPYRYDLAEAWQKLTGLPMVFAVWIARPEVPVQVLDELNAALEAGMQWLRQPDNPLDDAALDYLRHAIAYDFGPRQEAAIDQYLQWAATTSVSQPSLTMPRHDH